MKLHHKYFFSIVIIAMLGTWGCGSDSSSDGESETNNSSTSMSGSVTMGPVGHAEIKIYKLNDNGSRGELLTTVHSDENGEYSATISYSGPVEVVATGGSYEDEATGELIERGANEEIRTLVSKAEEGHVGINALTTIAAENASENASEGLEQAISSAKGEVQEMFGLSDVDIVKTKPADLTNSSEDVDEESAESKLGLAMAGVSQMASDNGIAPEDLDKMVQGISEDYSDGSFDGKKDGEGLSVALSVAPKQAMEGLSTALKNFAKGPRNAAGFSTDSLPSVPESPTQVTQDSGGETGETSTPDSGEQTDG